MDQEREAGLQQKGPALNTSTNQQLNCTSIPNAAPAAGLNDEQIHKAQTAFDACERSGSYSGPSARKQQPTQADILIKAGEAAELFHAPDGTGYADLIIDDHRETWPIRSQEFRGWLTRCFFKATGKAPSSEAMKSALGVIKAQALFDSPERVVYIRVGNRDGCIYVDLCDESWQAVEISKEGWRVIANPPVRFRRRRGMQPLPLPEQGGAIAALQTILNVRTDAEFALAVAWVLAALRDCGPYPVLVVCGEQGSAKSTFSSMLRALIDPNVAPLRPLPPDERDLAIAANNSWVLCFDNISKLQPRISDALCRLGSGGGFATRQLYTDDDEILFDITRPIILNGIEDFVHRSDLADRAVFLTLKPISDVQRRPQQELWSYFEKEPPGILGVLFDAVAQGLRMLPHTQLESLPRMADFALWITACETALWRPGRFEVAYSNNRGEAVQSVVDVDLVGSAIRTLMSARTMWTGTATKLLGDLEKEFGDDIDRIESWPRTPQTLSGQLHRLATFLRKLGIIIQFRREGRARTRMIEITRHTEKAD